MSWSTTLKNRQLIRTQLAAGEDIAVMFSDIRGFTRYTAIEGDRAAWRLARLHETLLRDEIEGHNGVLIKTLGDGIMAAFAELRDGVTAAVAIQRTIREENKQATTHPIDVGIGLACGTPVMTETDLFGNSVNMAQRLSSLAKSGQILVTKKLKDAVPLRDGLYYIPLGMWELKGLGKEEVYEIAWMAELFRISDARDYVTLVLTARGTVVVELAKRRGRETEHGRVKRFLLAFRRKHADPTTEVNREYPVTEVNAVLHRRTLVVHLGQKALQLRGVDPEQAQAFIERLTAMHQMRNEAPSAG